MLGSLERTESSFLAPDGANTPSCSRDLQDDQAIDPNLIVVYGGLAGVPADFFADRSMQEPEIPLASSTSILIAAESQRVNASINC